MLVKTRQRVTEVMGWAETQSRVLETRMDDLSRFGDEFDLIVALGIFQGAQSEAEWHGAVAEAARVLKPNAELLVAHFSPDSDPTGDGVCLVKGERHLYTGFSGHCRILLLHTDELDAWAAQHGLKPVTPTESVRVTTDDGYRTTVNAHYRKVAGGDLAKTRWERYSVNDNDLLTVEGNDAQNA